MTTIVYRDGIMASDSMEHIESEAGGHRKFLHCEKVYELADGSLIAGAGDSVGLDVFLRYWNDQTHENLELMSEYDFDVLWLDKDALWTADQSGVLIECKEPFYAIGSGAKAALGAMHMGASAELAVQIASKIDSYTDGEIRTYSLD